jgi:8-oxo-dGTP pyrophosphatase MutT (NUDIX family)
MIKRTETVEQHKGQISFPGGGVEAVDASPEETALREAEEEIGLRREDVEILGRLDDAMTLTSNYIVHPFVGLVPSRYAFTLNQAEVARLIRVPLEIFHPANLGARRSEVHYRGASYATEGYAYDGDVIWGATARIMENFMTLVGHKLLLPQRP